MSQPWKRWSYKQRTACSVVAFLVATVLFILNLAVDKSTQHLVLLAIVLLVEIPMILILFSASMAANRRRARGEEGVFPPTIAERRRKRDARRRGSS